MTVIEQAQEVMRQAKREIISLRSHVSELRSALLGHMANCEHCDPSGTYGASCAFCNAGRDALRLSGMSSQEIEDALYDGCISNPSPIPPSEVKEVA